MVKIPLAKVGDNLDTGWVTLTAADLGSTTWVPTTSGGRSSEYRVINKHVWVRLYLTSPADLAITGGADGNITDTTVATLPAAVPRPIADVYGMWGRPGFQAHMGSTVGATGTISARAWYPNLAVPAGVVTAFQFSYPVG